MPEFPERGLSLELRQAAPIPLAAQILCVPGELVALIGPSGSGKSSILRCIAGLLRPQAGHIVCHGRLWLDRERGISLTPQERRIGMVFQDYALFPHLSALDNVRLALGHLPRRHQATRASELLARVRLAGLEGRRPWQLSGGQRQRVALARALAREPTVLLLDEPFSAVDQLTRRKLQEELALLHRDISIPTLLVTHDLNEAAALADRIYVISRGRTLQSGPPDQIIDHPLNASVARLVGQRNLFRGRVRNAREGGTLLLEWQEQLLEVKANFRLAEGAEVDWMVSPSHIVWHRRDRPARGTRENPVEGIIRQVLPLGGISAVTLFVGGRSDCILHFNLPSHAVRRHRIRAGDHASVSLLAEGIHLMPEGPTG